MSKYRVSLVDSDTYAYFTDDIFDAHHRAESICTQFETTAVVEDESIHPLTYEPQWITIKKYKYKED